MRLCFLCLTTAALLALALTSSSAANPSGPVPGRFVVKLRPNVKSDAISKSIAKGIAVKRATQSRFSPNVEGAEVWDRYLVVATTDKSLAIEDVRELLGDDVVEEIEQDHYLEFFDFPSDPLFPQQWYLYNTGQEYLGIARIEGPNNDTLAIKHGIADADIDLAFFYQSPPTEATRVVVAIVDSGVDIDHPELQNQLWRNPDEIPNNGADDDHNGFIDDVYGYDISGDSLTLIDPIGDNDPRDDVGHGTHIAGIIASSHDGIGVAGIAPTAEIMSVKIQPNGTSLVGALGIVYAVNSGAQAINISWGTPFESGILLQALRFARENGVFVGIAPGNTGSNQRFYPAAYDSTFVIGAGNSDGFVTDFSTFGSHIDLVAPGLDILSLRGIGTDMYAEAGEPSVRIVDDDSLYYLSDGTSMAAPMAVGAAALLLSVRPDLSLPRLESILLDGARDLIDPYGNGKDTLVGHDSISGAGYLDIGASLTLLSQGGITFIEPLRRHRYTGDVPIKLSPVDGYSGGWRLEYTYQHDPANWRLLGEGERLSGDSLVFTFGLGFDEGIVHLRVIDDFGLSRQTAFIYVRERAVKIIYPQQNELLAYGVAVTGSTYGPDYDSLKLHTIFETGDRHDIFTSTGEYFDSLLFTWAFSGSDIGDYTLVLTGFFADTLIADSVDVTVSRSFAAGWPVTFAGNGGMTAVCTDLNRDGSKELAVPTTRGMYLYRGDGTVVDGWPVAPTQSLQCVPAVYDVDADGEDELICTGDSSINVLNYDGTSVEGWPQYCYTGRNSYEYGFPNPTVVQLGYEGTRDDSAIVIINKIGDIRAYQFDGTPYFFSLGGLFASFNPRISPFAGSGGQTSPFVTAGKLLGGDSIQVAAAYSSSYPFSGLGMFKGKNALPAIDTMLSPIVQNIALVDGMALADLDSDGRPEIVAVGSDSNYVPHIWVKKDGVVDMPGWPKAMTDVQGWISSYPVVADLELDGEPEILVTYFYYDIAVLYILRADGTAYATMEGRPEGQAFFERVTFGTPVVANITGDAHPEIIMRSGYILPGTGPELVFMLDFEGKQIDLSPLITLARPREVFSSRFAPLVDDLDSDGRVELILISDRNQVLVWDFPAPSEFGRNTGRFLVDNLNSGYYRFENVATDVPDQSPLLPSTPILSQNYPNPFNPTTTIRFSLPRSSHISLDVFNVLGQKVATLVDGMMSAGAHEVEFDGAPFASAMYFYRLNAGDFSEVRRMALVK